MKLSESLEAAFNAQITLEFQASLVYRQLAIELDLMDLSGHLPVVPPPGGRGDRPRQQVHRPRRRPRQPPAHRRRQAPTAVVGSVLDAFEAAYAHEQKVSESIRDLYRLAEAEGDLDSRPLLNWFLEEQIEEEATVSEIVGRVKMINDDGPGLLRLDEELGARTTPAVA